MKIIQVLKVAVYAVLLLIYVFYIRGEVNGVLQTIMDLLIVAAIALSLLVFFMKRQA